MPMAGLGSRFAKAGFTTPKPLIEVDGLPMFRKALSSIENISAEQSCHFVIRQEHVDELQLDRLITEALPQAQVIIVPELTRGAAETVLAAEPYLNPDDALIVMDCDLWFNSTEYNSMVESSLSGVSEIDGGLLTFKADNPRYSYAKIDENNIVTLTAEKVVISDRAITGAYFYATAHGFLASAHALLEQPLSETMPEYYLSLTYNTLIESGAKIQAALVDEYASFGTPEELQSYSAREV